MTRAKTKPVLQWILVAIGVVCVAGASWIHIKAQLAQALIAAAWSRTQRGAPQARPWPWADTQPVARLIVLGQHRHQWIVLEGSSGRNLAFGPAHDPASVLPGERGNSVIAGHRDTHFRVLADLRTGDRLRLERSSGEAKLFAVVDARVVDSRGARIVLDGETPRLTLVTCYPFDAIQPGGPLRFVVTADYLADAGNTPPRSVARAAPFFSSERVEPGQLAADRQLVDGLGAFVGDDAFEIQHVADGHVFRADARAAQHVARIASDVERHAAVVPFGEGYL